MSDEPYSSGSQQRRRPSRRAMRPEEESAPTVLTEDFYGVSASYGNTLLFVGYPVNGLVEITVYPRYRFSSDDRVQAQLGYVRVPPGTPWDVIMAQVDAIHEVAQRNYQAAVRLRAAELRAHGSRYESAYDAICETFRESWHGISVRLRREGEAMKGGMRFHGTPPGPVLVEYRGDTYSLVVFPTGSILLLRGDRQREVRDLLRGQ